MGKEAVHIVSIMAAAVVLAAVALFSALSQGRATASAVESIARQPEARGPIQQALVVGLAFIESLTLYALLIAIILIFVNPFK